MEKLVAELVLWKEGHGKLMVWGDGSWDCLLCKQGREESRAGEEILAKSFSKFPN